MSKSLSGYTTIDKSLSGIITISDGGGTTISQGDIICNSLTVTGGGGSGIVADNFNATTINPSDTTYYRVVLTDDRDNDGTPYPFYTDTWIQYVPENTVLYCAAWQVWCKVESQVPVASNEYSLYFGNSLITEAVNDIYKTPKVTYQPANQRLTVKNFTFSNSINGTTALDFSNYMSWIPLIYDGLAGNSSSGLPTYISSDNQVIFPTNLRTSQELTVDSPAYFNSNGNIYHKQMLVTDGDFLERTYMNIVLTGDGTTYSVNNVSGIDFTTLSSRFKSACRIYGRDNNAFSTDLIFATAPSGSAGNTNATERMIIMANGYIGIGTSNPTFNLEIAGETKTTALTVGNINASSVTNPSYVYCEKTSGNVVICNNASFTGTITIGNNTNLTGNVNLYGADCNLYGSNWKAVTQTAGDNSTKLATTEFVQNAVTTGGVGTYLSLNSSSTQVVNSNVGVIGTLLTSTPYPYTVVGSGTNQYETVICSDDGRFVYTYAIGGKVLYGSNDGGLTFSTLYTSLNNINSICCNGSGKYVIVSFASLVCQYSANFGSTFQAMTIAAVTTYFPINSVSCTFENSNLYVAFTNNNTTNSRIDVYVNTNGPAGTWITCGTITGKTAYLINHCWSNSAGTPFLSINTLAGQEIFLLTSPYTGSPASILSPYTFVGKIRSNHGGNFTQVAAPNSTYSMFHNTSAGAGGGYYSAVNQSGGVSSAHCNKAGTIFIYTSTTKLYISNNQYTQLVSFGSSVPTYSLLYTASGNIKDCWVSGNGMKIYFIVTGVVDTIYQISIQAPLSAYQTDFIVDKERQIVRSHKPMDTLGTFYDVLLRNKITHLTSTTTLTLPFTEFYQCDGATAFTLTLPAITDYMIGIQLTFFHMATKTITINCSSVDTIVPPATTIVLTGTTYAYTPTATLNKIGLLATYCGNVTKQYAWVIL